MPITPLHLDALTLGQLLCHPSPNVRRHAVGILKTLQEQESKADLNEALNTPDGIDFLNRLHNR